MNLSILNLKALKSEVLRTSPYEWGVTEKTFVSGNAARSITMTFPEKEFFGLVEREGGSKPYRMYRCTLVDTREKRRKDVPLPLPWEALLNEVQSSKYREAIELCAGLSLQECQIEVTAWEYRKSCWLSPHVDEAEKVVTQVIYLNESWNPAWGGTLCILRGPTFKDTVEKISPALGTSAIIVRSERSYHAVQKVTYPDAPPRRSLQVAFKR